MLYYEFIKIHWFQEARGFECHALYIGPAFLFLHSSVTMLIVVYVHVQQLFYWSWPESDKIWS